MKPKLVVLSGAGMSAESGISTFRDSNGLWENHDIMEVASPVGWKNNRELVLEFYNQRRKNVLEAEPNKAHYLLAELEKDYDVYIVTQNIDDLHERAGSTNVLHLHGEIKKSRSSVDINLVYDIEGWEIKMGEKCEKGSQLRPHIVWFGEPVPAMEEAIEITSQSDIFLVIGTSLQVYPAAGLIDYVPHEVAKYVIDPNLPELSQNYNNLIRIEATASKGMGLLVENYL